MKAYTWQAAHFLGSDMTTNFFCKFSILIRLCFTFTGLVNAKNTSRVFSQESMLGIRICAIMIHGKDNCIDLDKNNGL